MGYDTYAVTEDGGGGCCFNLGRVILMFITVLTITFTIGALIISSAALHSVYSTTWEPSEVDRRGIVQLWLLVAASALAVITNACGFAGALSSNRRLLLIYACVTAVAVAVHLVVIYMKQWASQAGQKGSPLNITDDPQSVWTLEMNTYAAEVMKRPALSQDSTTQQINQTVSEVRSRLLPHPDAVREAALRTVNSIQTFFKCCGQDGLDDYITDNITVPESCCRPTAGCNATLRHAPFPNVTRLREATFSRGCGPYLQAAHSVAVTVVTWLSYVVAGSQLCGAAVAAALGVLCMD